LRTKEAATHLPKSKVTKNKETHSQGVSPSKQPKSYVGNATPRVAAATQRDRRRIKPIQETESDRYTRGSLTKSTHDPPIHRVLPNIICPGDTQILRLP